ncbi:MAG: hypothetical protein GY931_10075 [Maribacter sp.]|nr:hypothetical protein [Maribacter sp.]
MIRRIINLFIKPILFSVFTFCISSCGILDISGGSDNDKFYFEKGLDNFTAVLRLTENADGASQIIQTNDGGFLVSGDMDGTIAPSDGTLSKRVLIKFDKNLSYEWSKNYGEKGFNHLSFVVQDSDNDYVVLIPSNSVINQFYTASIKLLRFGSNGFLIGEIFNKNNRQLSNKTLFTKTGNDQLLLVGRYSYNGDSPNYGTTISHFSSNGDFLSDKELPQSEGSVIAAIKTSGEQLIAVSRPFEDYSNYFIAISTKRTQK